MSQSRCVAVDRPAWRAVTPHVAQQLFAGEHARGFADQRLQQLELLRCQLDLPLADTYLARAMVDGQRGDSADRCGARLVGSAQQDADAAAHSSG